MLSPLLNLASGCCFPKREKLVHKLSSGIIAVVCCFPLTTPSPFLDRKANEFLQRMALLLAPFHRNRNRKVIGKAKWVGKAPHRVIL